MGKPPGGLARGSFEVLGRGSLKTDADPAARDRLDGSDGRPGEGNMYTKASYGTAAGEGAVFVVTGSSSRVRALSRHTRTTPAPWRV